MEVNRYEKSLCGISKSVNKKGIGIVLVCLLAGLAFWYLLGAISEVYHYTQWKVKSDAIVDHWSVEELKADQFVVRADYQYAYQGKNYKNRGSVGGVYPNPWAASEAKERFSKQNWSIWLDPKHPERSVFEKVFPLKRTLSALILLGIALYFVILSIYLRTKNG